MTTKHLSSLFPQKSSISSKEDTNEHKLEKATTSNSGLSGVLNRIDGRIIVVSILLLFIILLSTIGYMNGGRNKETINTKVFTCDEIEVNLLAHNQYCKATNEWTSNIFYECPSGMINSEDLITTFKERCQN